jgi:hypothetical protein
VYAHHAERGGSGGGDLPVTHLTIQHFTSEHECDDDEEEDKIENALTSSSFYLWVARGSLHSPYL